MTVTPRCAWLYNDCNLLGEQERQLLLDVAQSVLFIEKASVNVRKLCVTMPKLTGDGSRVVWCPRCPRGSLVGRSHRRVSECEGIPELAAGETMTRRKTVTGSDTVHCCVCLSLRVPRSVARLFLRLSSRFPVQ